MDTEDKVLLSIFVTIALAVGFFVTAADCGKPGSGYSVGTVVNVANEGVLWSRPKLYLLHSGEMKAESFALESEDLAKRAAKFADSGERVRLHYTEYLACWRWNYADCAVVDAIEPEKAER